MSCQTFALYPANNHLVDLCPNLWFNNSKVTFFLGIFLFDSDFSFIFTKNVCFICVVCDNVATFFSLSLKKTVQNTLWKSKVCPNLINVIMEINKSHKFGTNRMLYNAVMKVFPLSLWIFIWTPSICFAAMECPSATLIYLSVSRNETGIKSEIYGVMWQVTPESKIQVVSYKLSP